MSDEVDPRYDPRFQRGFSGPAPVAERPGPREPRPDVPSRVPPEPDQRTGAARAGDAREPGAADPEPSAPATVLVERPLSANPFVWGLLVVGTALVVAGVVTFTGWNSLTGGSAQQIDYALLQFLIGVTPVLLALGGATLLGVGFLFAIDRQRRTRVPAVIDPPAGSWAADRIRGR